MLPAAEIRALSRRGARQKLTVLDSEIMLANLIGSMKEAFKLLRSASVTPRATEQAPQTRDNSLS